MKKAPSFDVPIDCKGVCIFHSRDKEFKASHTANKRFRKLLEAFHWAMRNGFGNEAHFDCDEFYFTGEVTDHPELSSSEVIDLSEIAFGVATTFIGATFEDEVWFNYATFKGITSFEKAHFNAPAHFENATFERQVRFTRAIFSGAAGYRETEFKNSVEFPSCQFQSEAAFYRTQFGSYVSFDKAHFHGNVYFTDSDFKQGINESVTSFRAAHFNAPARFENSRFYGEVTFQSARFANAEFIDVEFSPKRKLVLDGIVVTEKLIFKSLDPNNKTFSHAVSFRLLDQDIKGQIIFENANVYFIEQQDVVQRLMMPPREAIVLGPGCDRYKLRLEFAIPMEERWMFLIKEMAETFVMFVDWQEALTAKLNVECEYRSDKILVRYFSDCDISREHFETLLKARAPAFLELIKNPEAILKGQAQTLSPESLIKAYDVYRKAASTRMGIVPRIKFDSSWTLYQTKALLQSICLPARKPAVIEFHMHASKSDVLALGTPRYGKH